MRLALLWTALLLALLFAPGGWIVSPPHGVAFLGHVVLFGVSGLLWGRALPGRELAVLVVLGVLAVATELVQGTELIGRGNQPLDLVADGVGIALAGLGLWARRARGQAG